ncbi:MAG: cation:proton antiporter, partial [Bryobacteraceae bacterium]|nr:cation:proton antiporter [Bryobacteraceae bacterium]
MAAAAAELPLSMLLVFGVAKLAAELSERARQPAIVGEILAGMVLGPAVLGWVRPNELLHALAELGVMFLLFNVGLHTRASDLKSVGPVATLVAILGVIVPLIAGWGILTLASHTPVEAFFLGAAMVATSVGITAQVLQSGGFLHLQASRIILAAAVIDDVLGLLVLAVVSSFAKGSVNWTEIAFTAFLAIAFVVFVVQFGARAAEKIIPRVRESMRAAESDFAIAMTILFALALLSVYAGVAAIIGAFLAGMMLSSTTGERARLFTQGAAELLVPFFLVSIG